MSVLGLLVMCCTFARERASADEAVADASPTTTINVFGSTMTVPAAFTAAEKQSRIIAHEFAASDDGGETARVTMMAAGGGIQANLDRWKGQFGGDDKEIGDTKEFKSGPFNAYLLKVSGKYAETMGGGPFSGGRKVMRDNYAMLGAILVKPIAADGSGPSYFIKMIGPKSVIESNADAFETMIKSVE
ncbi:MAG: hypothetical protein AAF539_00605 [Planctomycetota bacterium]